MPSSYSGWLTAFACHSNKTSNTATTPGKVANDSTKLGTALLYPARCPEPSDIRATGSNRPAAREQVDDQHDDRDHQENVDQTSCHVESPAKQP